MNFLVLKLKTRDNSDKSGRLASMQLHTVNISLFLNLVIKGFNSVHVTSTQK